jgi:hypothetical protein
VTGALTNNNAAPTATLQGVLPAIAETSWATVTYTTGDMVLPVTDLHGALNTDLQAIAGSPISTAQTGVQKVGITGNSAQIIDYGVGASTLASYLGVGAYYVSSGGTANLTGNMGVLQADSAGDLFVKPYRRSQVVSQATTIAASTSATTVLAAQAASTFADISNLIITPSPIATTAIDFTATLSDGTKTYIFGLNTGVTATGTGSGPLVINFNPPLPATTAATAWTITLSSALVLDCYIVVIAVIGKAS